MRFAIIDGSKQWTGQGQQRSMRAPSIDVEDVEAEARRRLKAIRLDQWRTREFLTGTPMPDDIRQLALQIDYAAQAISRLSPIPEDFDSDVYWPRLWER